MAAIVPSNLQLMAGRFANLERTTVRVRPMSNDAVGSGQTIHFRMPTNTLIDLHNLQFFGTCTIEGSGGSRVFGLPRRMAQAIERVDVVVNGQSIQGNNSDYGALDHLLTSWTKDRDFYEDHHDFLTSGDNKVSKIANTAVGGATSAQTGIAEGMREAIKSANTGTGVTNNNTTYLYRDNENGGGNGWPRKFPFLINGLHGFLSGEFVRFIDTAVLGPVELRIRLHNPNIMYRSSEHVGAHGISDYHDTVGPETEAKAAYNDFEAPDFTWSNMYMILDTISFPDDFYRALLAERLQGGGIIGIPYPNYFSFNKAMSSNSDTVTFNLATQSLDYLMATFRNMMYIRRNSKRWSNNAKNTNFFKFVSVDNNDYSLGEYTSKTTYQYMVNNKLMPSWPVNVDEAYALTKAAFDQARWRPTQGNGYPIKYAGEYRDGLFAFVQAFNHHAEQDKIVSGLDTRGASSNMAFAVSDSAVQGTVSTPAVEGLYSQVQVMIWAKTTSSIEISAGQNVVTIF